MTKDTQVRLAWQREYRARRRKAISHAKLRKPDPPLPETEAAAFGQN